MSISDHSALRSTLARLESPGLVKVSQSLRSRSEDRAAAAFRAGIVAAGLSQRAAARRLGICERLLRDYLAGARQLPAWAPLALPRDGQIAYLRFLVEADEFGQAEDEESALLRTGTGAY